MDFPVAASRGKLELFKSGTKIYKSHEFMLNRHHAIALINSISPIQLCKIACRAAVFASACLFHHPISRKEKIPTPSHPMKSWKRLLAVTRINIVIRRTYLKN